MDNVRIVDRDLNKIYPDLRVRFQRLKTDMQEHYKPIFLVEGFRSYARQKWINDEKAKTIIAALPGNSWHQYGLAIDVAFLGANPYSSLNPWMDLRRIAIAHGFEAIGRIDTNGEVQGDKDHFQLRYGLSMAEVKSLYEVNGIGSVWARIDGIRGVPMGEKWYSVQPDGGNDAA